MRYAVRLLRFKGRILPAREVVNRPAVFGDLRVEECRDEELRRYVRTATLHDPRQIIGGDGLPRLYDVRLLAMSQKAFTLTGFERIDGADYAQSWLVTAP